MLTSASWLNMVGRFFRDLTDQRLRRGVFRSEAELIAAIYDHIAQDNHDPKLFHQDKEGLRYSRKGQARLQGPHKCLSVGRTPLAISSNGGSSSGCVNEGPKDGRAELLVEGRVFRRIDRHGNLVAAFSTLAIGEIVKRQAGDVGLVGDFGRVGTNRGLEWGRAQCIPFGGDYS